MKSVRKKAAWIFGVLGVFSASAELVHAAQLGDRQVDVAAPAPAQGEAAIPIVNPGGAIPTQAQDRLQEQLLKLRSQYGDDMMEQLVLDVSHGQLRVVGLKTDGYAPLMDREKPTSN